MIREIIHDPIRLAKKSEVVTREDLGICEDLWDTLLEHKEECVGMAANMIGVSKSIIIVNDEGAFRVFLNPTIIKKEAPFDTEEGCLSLAGVRKCRRYRKIKLQYQNQNFETRLETFTGWTAQIIQHEIDHCNGILI